MKKDLFSSIVEKKQMNIHEGYPLRFQAGILGYSIAGMKAFEGKFSYKNQLFS